jgi:transcriptional regulator with XRE-family HTH domain
MTDMVDEALGQALRKLRTQRGWTQTDLALRAEMGRNYLSQIELGHYSPSVRMLVRLCRALDVRPAHVLDDMERREAALEKPQPGATLTVFNSLDSCPVGLG